MGKIKKLKDVELVGGTEQSDVYPITSTKAIYDENNKRLDSILSELQKSADSSLETENKTIVGSINELKRLLDEGYLFKDVATTKTNPGTPDAKVFYIAKGKGTYTNFGNIEVTEDEVVVLYWDSSWHKVSTGIASNEKLSELESEVSQLGQETSNTTMVLNGNITGEYVIDENSPLHPGYVTSGGIHPHDSYHYCVIENNENYSAIVFDTNTPADVDYIIFERSDGTKIATGTRDSATIAIYADVVKIYFNFFGGEYANKFSIISSYSIQEQFESTFNVAKYINRGYINTNGEYVSSEIGWSSTDLFEVVGNQKIKVFGIADNESMLCFYDKDRNPILPLVYITNPGFNLVDVPDTAYYCRCSLFYGDKMNNMGVIIPIVSKNEQSDDNVVNYTKDSPGVQIGYVNNQIYSGSHHYLYVEFNNDNDRTPDYIEFSGSIKPAVAYVQLKIGDSIIAYAKTAVESGRFPIPPCDGVYLNFFDGEGYAESFTIHYSEQIIQLFESIDKPFNFNGKHLVAYGDSITWGVYSPGLGRTETSSYIAQFCLKTNAILNNRGWSGATLTYKEGSSLGCISQRIMSESFADADIIWVAAGTNDYQDQRPIGNFGDSDNTTMYGAMKVVCDYLSQTYSGKPVIFMTPIPFTKASSSFGKPISLDKYRKAIEEVACANGYSVINGASLGIIESAGGYGNAMIDDTDGCHPTLEGHKLMARSLCGKLL